MSRPLTPKLAKAKIAAVRDVLADLEAAIDDGALDMLHDNQPGYPSGDSGPRGKGGHSDRTQSLALAERPDQARADLDLLDHLLGSGGRALLDAERIARRWRPPSQVWRDALATEAAAKLSDDAWCASCLRVGSMAPRREEGGDLCRWCADTLRAIDRRGQLPLWLVERHAQGARLTTIDIARARKEMGTAKRKGRRGA